jgi:Fur family ferric uptake transcriptional regulator
MCRSCGLILDVPAIDGTEPSLPRGGRHGFLVDDVEVTFRGLCPRCAGA